MSSTGRSDVRRTDDAYMTPRWCIHRLLDVWTPPVGILVEPACGDSIIIREICGFQYHWISYDLREVRPVAQWHRQCDFLTDPPRLFNSAVKAVVTNPPYSLAEEFVRRSRTLYPYAELVFLLRLAFLASEKRLLLWQNVGTPDIYVLPNRPSFTGGGTDSTDYAWFIWHVDHRNSGILRVLASTPPSERNS